MLHHFELKKYSADVGLLAQTKTSQTYLFVKIIFTADTGWFLEQEL